ncbi:two-component regulator propeller domain-containing protein [Chishuiella sp.]|uniref:type IX secretion system anionic LPS delivery protein PorZ n=1 Tax=Chishuiella sp. TaxID=1969467 RepID=UPI0028AFAF51|nr:two-component regulator propeller domain-containing protein [Chishuiella sp.]
MKKKLFVIIILIFIQLSAQTNKGRWGELFSYGNVKYLENVKGIIYCGTENGIFLFNPQEPTSELVKINKTNYLNNVGLSAMAYDENSDSFLVGYENGGLDLLKSGNSTMVLDIKWNEFNGNKNINNIYIYNNIAFISGAFGIVSYDLNDEEFKETTRTSFIVNDATILDNKIYIATTDGIRYSELQNGKNNPNINSWGSIENGQNISNIELLNNEIYYSIGNNLKSINGNANSYSSTILDLKSSGNQLIISQGNQLSVLGGSNYYNYNFNTGIYVDNKIYAGTNINGLIDFTNTTINYKPQGPYSNKSYSVTAKNNKIWIAPGGIENYNNVTFNADGFSFFDSQNWNHYSSESLNNAKDIIKIALDPTDENHFMVIPYAEVVGWGGTQIGIFEFNGYSSQPKHITSPLPQIYRFGGGSYDDQGNFYLSESFYCDSNCMSSGIPNYNLVNVAINSLSVNAKSGGNWTTTQRTNEDASNALSPIIDNKYIYIPQARAGGVAVIRKNNYDVVGNILTTGEQSLPNNNVWSSALDKTGNLWIGTERGLAVAYGIEAAADNNDLKAEPIVIVQDGIAEALLTNLGVYSITVDAANRKWIGTNGGGVYYVSENGEETKLHFTTKNSPLPSDIIYGITVDESTGKVYFATEKGAVSYNGDVSSESTNFNKALAYPNPYRPTYKGNITIKNLPDRSSVKITDIVGNILFDKKAEGGVVEWDTNNFKGKPVASGIYLVLMVTPDGSESKTLKIAVVR